MIQRMKTNRLLHLMNQLMIWMGLLRVTLRITTMSSESPILQGPPEISPDRYRRFIQLQFLQLHFQSNADKSENKAMNLPMWQICKFFI